MHIFPSELGSLAEELQGITLDALDLRCLHDAFDEDDEALLAQCSIMELIVHFVDPRTRLKHVPAGAQVWYRLLDPDLAAAASSMEWPPAVSEEHEPPPPAPPPPAAS